MKILKYIFLLLLLCGIAGFVFIATQPSDYSVTKSKEINVSKDIVFNFVNDYQNAHYWNSTIKLSSSKELFSEDSKTYTISNENESIVYETLKVFKTDSIVQKLTQENSKHNLVWTFAATKKGTLLSCIMKGKMTLKQKMFSLFQGGNPDFLGDEIENNLKNIEKYLDNQLNKYNIKINGVVTFKSTLYIKQIDSSSIKLYNSIAKNKISNLIRFAKDNTINYTDKPFVLLDSWKTTNNKTKFSICLPIKEEVITSEGSEINGGEILEFKAVKITLNGDYSHVRKAWEEGVKFIEKNKLIEDTKGTYIESYIVYPPKEMQASKWITEIYIPIKVAIAPKRKPVSTTETTVETIPTPTE